MMVLIVKKFLRFLKLSERGKVCKNGERIYIYTYKKGIGMCLGKWYI